MKITISLDANKEIPLHELSDALQPWLDSNENLSVYITPFYDIESDVVVFGICRKEKAKE